MMQRSVRSARRFRSFFPFRSSVSQIGSSIKPGSSIKIGSTITNGFAVAALLTTTVGAYGQAPQTDATPAAQPPADIVLSNPTSKAAKPQKDDKVVQSKDTKKEEKKYKKDNPLEGQDAKLPDKELYDKAMDAVKHGRYDVARLDLQTLLNTYPDSQFMMRAKLAIADSWYKEGGTAALTQAEQEYRDFITFFPNAPEAAEAQMRVGDIYFKEMDKPDRDHSKAMHAEEEYRLMLQQFPDSPRIPEAAQRLREVQESLATADADVAAFYATHQNWAAAIARYQTVADTYPQYSHMDDVLVGLGDAYEAEARFYRTTKQPLPEAARARLEKLYDDQAIAAWRKVVTEHSAAPHVEDARDRLAAMSVPIPTPTKEQAAASEALENSRGTYTLSNRAKVFILHQPDTVQAATIGTPPLADPKPTLAPTIVRQGGDDFIAAINPAANTSPAAAIAPGTQAEGTQTGGVSAQNTTPAPQPLAFQDVPAANGVAPSGAISTVPAATAMPSSGGGSGVGMEIIQPGSGSPKAPVTPPSAPPAFPGTAAPAATTPAPAAAVRSSDANGGLQAVGPTNTTVMAPIEKAPAAPDAINEVVPGSQPAAQTAANGKKTPNPAFDKSDESSSKHKKKKGLAKLNPF